MPQVTEVRDVIVVGAGMVGAAIAYGLSRNGMDVCLLDQGDVAFRASRGNFGLVWVQAKGPRFYRYAEWSRRSAQQWPALAADLARDTGIDVELEQPGGFYFSFTDEDMLQRDALLSDIRDHVEGEYPFEMLSRDTIYGPACPEIGDDVVGGSYTPMDGHVHPLKTLQALLAGCSKHGAVVPGLQGLAVEVHPPCGVLADLHESPDDLVSADVREDRLASDKARFPLENMFVLPHTPVISTFRIAESRSSFG